MFALCFMPWFSVDPNITEPYWGYYALPAFLPQFLLIAGVLVRKTQSRHWLYLSEICVVSFLPILVYLFIYWRLYMNITTAPLQLSLGVQYTVFPFWCFSITTFVFCLLFQVYFFKSISHK